MKILIADDHPLVRMGVSEQLQKLYSNCTVTEAGSYPEAESQCSKSQFDLIILDWWMDGIVLETIANISTHNPGAKIVLYTGHISTFIPVNILKKWIHGFASKTQPLESFIKVIETVLSGQPLALDLEFSFMQFMMDKLTDREVDVSRLMSMGYSSKEISKALGIAVGTVERHRNNVLPKFGVSSASSLTRLFQFGSVSEERFRFEKTFGLVT
jgi:DNA-binding NarL/FixJ family response regulator